MWSVSGPGIHDELQRLVCWCTVRQVTDVVKNGITRVNGESILKSKGKRARLLGTKSRHDSQEPISYSRSIVTKSLSPAVSEIMGIKYIGGHDLDLSGSRDVIGHVTIGLGMGHFLLVVFGPKSLTVSEIFRPKRAHMLNRHCACAYHVTNVCKI